MIKEIDNIVNEIIISKLDLLGETQISDEKNLIDDLGMESLQIMSVLIDLEERFDIEIDIDMLDDIQNIGKMKKYIKKLIVENNNC